MYSFTVDNCVNTSVCVSKKKHSVRGASLFGLGSFALLLYLYGTCLHCIFATDNGNIAPRRKVFELHLSVILR